VAKDAYNSVVTDPWGQQVMILESTKKNKQTTLSDGQRRVVAHVDWDHFHPRIEFAGHKMKTHELLPALKHTK
jgi:hypothetical protein